MIIDLRNIVEEPKFFSFTLHEKWWQSEKGDDPILGFEGPLDARIEVYRAGDKFLLKGTIEGRVIVRCDRCLAHFGLDVRSRFENCFALSLNQGDQDEVELEEEDLEVDFIKGEEIDLKVVLREQIYLSLPVKLICRPECVGLCPRCGVNLNEGQCQCPKSSGHPGFAKLKNLQIQGR